MGSVAGAALVYPVTYAVWGINGGGWQDSVGKAFALVGFGAAGVFIIAACRFRFLRQWNVGFIFLGLG